MLKDLWHNRTYGNTPKILDWEFSITTSMAFKKWDGIAYTKVWGNTTHVHEPVKQFG